MNVNQFIAVGHITKDPDVKDVGSSKVAVFRLAINRSFKRNNEWVDRPTFVDCEAWNQRAEFVESRLQRGTEVYIRGRLETDEWEKDGQKRSKLKVYVLEIQAGKGKKEAVAATTEPTSGLTDLPF